jgi:cold shock CspA family protein
MYLLFDDADIDRHIKSLQGALKAPKRKQSSSAPTTVRKSTEKVTMGIHLGVCQFFDSIKGFGFIRPDTAAAMSRDGRDRDDADLFVHAKNLCGIATLDQGQRVSFDISESKRKPGQLEAKNVRLVDAA